MKTCSVRGGSSLLKRNSFSLSVSEAASSRSYAGVARGSTAVYASRILNANNFTIRVSNFHSSVRRENELIYGGIVLAGGAMTMRYALQLYNSIPSSPSEVEEGDGAAADGRVDAKRKKSAARKGENPLDSLWATWFARNFYDGGFEEKMTRREAARVLGVRESATAERVKDAHRRILLLNHPDKGGSPYIAAKINEAKDMLIKGKQ